MSQNKYNIFSLISFHFSIFISFDIQRNFWSAFTHGFEHVWVIWVFWITVYYEGDTSKYLHYIYELAPIAYNNRLLKSKVQCFWCKQILLIFDISLFPNNLRNVIIPSNFNIWFIILCKSRLLSEKIDIATWCLISRYAQLLR